MPSTIVDNKKANFICSKYEIVSYNNLYNHAGENILSGRYTGGRGYINFYSSDAMANKTANEVKAAMSGVMLYYELATPIETDISSLLSDDNLINVEPGGTLTFRNQHEDDFRLPVPNEETYFVQAAPELPSADGTYTLQCTVTDGTPSVTWVSA
jgi:hypothetical protein